MTSSLDGVSGRGIIDVITSSTGTASGCGNAADVITSSLNGTGGRGTIDVIAWSTGTAGGRVSADIITSRGSIDVKTSFVCGENVLVGVYGWWRDKAVDVID